MKTRGAIYAFWFLFCMCILWGGFLFWAGTVSDECGQINLHYQGK